jgi:hypothetical protein
MLITKPQELKKKYVVLSCTTLSERKSPGDEYARLLELAAYDKEFREWQLEVDRLLRLKLAKESDRSQTLYEAVSRQEGISEALDVFQQERELYEKLNSLFVKVGLI